MRGTLLALSTLGALTLGGALHDVQAAPAAATMPGGIAAPAVQQAQYVYGAPNYGRWRHYQAWRHHEYWRHRRWEEARHSYWHHRAPYYGYYVPRY